MPQSKDINQLIKTNLKLTHMLELADKDIKIIIKTKFYMLES